MLKINGSIFYTFLRWPVGINGVKKKCRQRKEYLKAKKKKINKNKDKRERKKTTKEKIYQGKKKKKK